jgi:N,N'-diacetyllegionaminate synthase
VNSSSFAGNNMSESKVVIIAEAGVNHNGSIDLARKLIDIAAESGVDYVKFQTWVTEETINQDAPKADYQKINDGEKTSQFEMLKNLELSFEDFKQLQAYAHLRNVKFLSTPDELKSLNFLVDELKIETIKIGSGEINNLPFLRKVGNKKLDVIISTGMSNLGDVEKALTILNDSGAKSVTLLHCTSNYPAPYDSINLKAMQTLKDAFKIPVGYSDHTEGIEVSIAAVALGAKVIEKHFTIDKNMEGPDHKASLSPNELKELVRQIRNVENAISGSGRKLIQESEQNIKVIMTKGLYLSEDVSEGSSITEDMFLFKRPVVHLPATLLDSILGKKVNKDLAKGHAISFADIIHE